MFKTSLSSLNTNKPLMSTSNIKSKVQVNNIKPTSTATTKLTLISQSNYNNRPVSAKSPQIQKSHPVAQVQSTKQTQFNNQVNLNSIRINEYPENNLQTKAKSQIANNRPVSQQANSTKQVTIQPQSTQRQQQVNQQQFQGGQDADKQRTENPKQVTLPNQQTIKQQRPLSSLTQTQNQKAIPVKSPPMRDMGRAEPLFDCPEGCGRSFNELALSKHAKICKKVFQQKRKEFNSSKQRQVEQDNVPTKRQPNKNSKNQVKPSTASTTKNVTQAPMPKVNWRTKSEALRSVIKQGRGVQLTQEQSKQVSQAMSNAQNLVACKWCDRKFNETAAARHIPVCEKKSKENKIRLGSQAQQQKSPVLQKTQQQSRLMSGTQKNKQY